MERKDGQKNTETLRIRISKELLDRIKAARVPSGWEAEAESSFARHLLILGIREAERKIEESLANAGKDQIKQDSAG